MTLEPSKVEQFFGVSEVPEIIPRYNIAPSQQILAICQNGDGYRHARSFRWGLVPSWSKDPAIGNKMINARSETVGEKPAFRGPIRYHRCLIPANGFYEWSQQGKVKVPFYIHRKDQEPLAFAGIWDTWKGTDEVIESCSILTTDANSLISKLHDRMPVILSQSEFAAWLDREVTDVEKLKLLFAPFPSDMLDAIQVSSLVNNSRNDSSECLKQQR
jgi:putative SOS response-associated peptidase YedK